MSSTPWLAVINEKNTNDTGVHVLILWEETFWTVKKKCNIDIMCYKTKQLDSGHNSIHFKSDCDFSFN